MHARLPACAPWAAAPQEPTCVAQTNARPLPSSVTTALRGTDEKLVRSARADAPDTAQLVKRVPPAARTLRMSDDAPDTAHAACAVAARVPDHRLGRVMPSMHPLFRAPGHCGSSLSARARGCAIPSMRVGPADSRSFLRVCFAGSCSAGAENPGPGHRCAAARAPVGARHAQPSVPTVPCHPQCG